MDTIWFDTTTYFAPNGVPVPGTPFGVTVAPAFLQ